MQAELAAAAADQLHALEDELANVKETNEHLQSELMTLERDCASLEQHDEQRSAAMEEMQNENTRLRSQSDVLEVKAREIESKLKAKQLENGELRARAKQEVDALRKGLTDGKSKAKVSQQRVGGGRSWRGKDGGAYRHYTCACRRP